MKDQRKHLSGSGRDKPHHSSLPGTLPVRITGKERREVVFSVVFEEHHGGGRGRQNSESKSLPEFSPSLLRCYVLLLCGYVVMRFCCCAVMLCSCYVVMLLCGYVVMRLCYVVILCGYVMWLCYAVMLCGHVMRLCYVVMLL